MGVFISFAFTFNRTMKELKYVALAALPPIILAFNRTMKELKLQKLIISIASDILLIAP